MNIKFKGHDSGNCRIYGTYNRKLYCIMDGYNNYGYMGLFACSKDGEPSHQLDCDYTFDGLPRAEIETIKTRNGESGWGDRVLMNRLNRELREWDY